MENDSMLLASFDFQKVFFSFFLVLWIKCLNLLENKNIKQNPLGNNLWAGERDERLRA